LLPPHAVNPAAKATIKAASPTPLAIIASLYDTDTRVVTVRPPDADPSFDTTLRRNQNIYQLSITPRPRAVLGGRDHSDLHHNWSLDYKPEHVWINREKVLLRFTPEHLPTRLAPALGRSAEVKAN
jgi:hypothetical protein